MFNEYGTGAKFHGIFEVPIERVELHIDILDILT